MQAWLSHAWLYPALEVVHLLGIALLLGNLAALEVRLWGGAASLDVAGLARLCIGLALCGFGLAALSGLLMFAMQAQELLSNRSFVWKMGLLLLAGCNAAAFHARASLQHPDGWARIQLAASVVLWLAVLVLGRWIAY